MSCGKENLNIYRFVVDIVHKLSVVMGMVLNESVVEMHTVLDRNLEEVDKVNKSHFVMCDRYVDLDSFYLR
jgi:hypothetical protein